MANTITQPPPVEGRSSERELARTTAELVAAANVSGRFLRGKHTAATSTLTEIFSLGVPKNTAWLVEVVFLARATAGGSAVGSFVRRATFYRDAGDVSQQGTTLTIGSDENNLGGTSTVEISVDNSDTTTKKVRARVKDGGAATDWVARVEVQAVTAS